MTYRFKIEMKASLTTEGFLLYIGLRLHLDIWGIRGSWRALCCVHAGARETTVDLRKGRILVEYNQLNLRDCAGLIQT